MNLKNKEKLLYLSVVPVNSENLILGIKNFMIDSFMGLSLEGLKWPLFLSLIFSIFSFAIASYFIVRYTKEFYAKGTIPSSWQFILWGIIAMAIAEIGDLLIFYEWPRIGFIETNFLLIIPHTIGGILIGYGTYLLYKEIKD